MLRRNRTALAGSTVLVTGATGGLGQAIARSLAARGARLLITGRREDVLDQLATELGARPLTCDLESRDQVAQLGAEAVAAGVNVLVANAGLPGSGELVDLSQEQLDRVLEVNLRAPIALAKALAPSMIERHSGHIVFISSLSGKATSPGTSAYCATKFGLRGFALALRADLRRDGVGVSVVLPGFVRDIGMFADAQVKLPPGVGTSSPEEVAAAVVRAIAQNRGELSVAPIGLRVGASIAAVAPGLAAGASRVLGADRIAARFAAGQRDKR